MEAPISEKYLKQLHQLIENYLHGYHVKVYLFGSRATGKARRTSDIDIALLPLDPVPSDFFIRLRELIEESTIPYQIDIVDLREADDDLKNNIFSEGKLWID